MSWRGSSLRSAVALAAGTAPLVLVGGSIMSEAPSSVRPRAAAEAQPVPRPEPVRAARTGAGPPEGATAGRESRPTVVRVTPTGRAFSGVASWYGPGFHGRTTANGERYDQDALTAASRTLPFGTRLQVCRGPRCVVVRVNDRGPYVGERVLDLSRGAARVLGLQRPGVGVVRAVPVTAVTSTVPVLVREPRVLGGARLPSPGPGRQLPEAVAAALVGVMGGMLLRARGSAAR